MLQPANDSLCHRVTKWEIFVPCVTTKSPLIDCPEDEFLNRKMLIQ